MMKKYTKYISLTLAILMLALAVPFTASAEATETLTYGTVTGTKVLDMAHLKASNTVTENAASITAYDEANATIDAEDGSLVVNANQTKWRCGIRTNLGLDMGSQYVITFKSKLLDTLDNKDDIIGYYFNGSDYPDTQGIYYNGDSQVSGYYLAKWNQYSGNAANKYIAVSENKITEECNYILVLDKGAVSLYRDGELVFNITLTSYTHNMLSVGFMAMKVKSFTTATELATMTDIKVYEGTYDPKSNVEDEEDFSQFPSADNLVLAIDHLGDTTNAVTGEGAATFTSHHANTGITENGNVTHAGAVSSSYKWRAGINTDLDLNATSQYVITFKSKLNFASEENINRFAFFFTGDTYTNTQGVYYQDNDEKYYIGIYDAWAGNSYIQNSENMLAEECEYVLTLNNLIISLYRDGEKVFSTTTTYKADKLSVGMMGMHNKISNGSQITIEAGTDLATMTDIKVYNNAVFEPNGKTEVQGMQYTAPEGNQQSIRFIASLQTLKAEDVGFEISAKYVEKVEGEDVVKTKKWNVNSKAVYTSIMAEEGGTAVAVVSNELGGFYLIALAIDEVPTNIGQIDFYVKSYVTVDGEPKYSQEAIFTVKDGKAEILDPLS